MTFHHQLDRVNGAGCSVQHVKLNNYLQIISWRIDTHVFSETKIWQGLRVYVWRQIQEVFEDTKGSSNQNYTEEQTTQWTREKVQMDNQRSTNHTHKT